MFVWQDHKPQCGFRGLSYFRYETEIHTSWQEKGIRSQWSQSSGITWDHTHVHTPTQSQLVRVDSSLFILLGLWERRKQEKGANMGSCAYVYFSFLSTRKLVHMYSRHTSLQTTPPASLLIENCIFPLLVSHKLSHCIAHTYRLTHREEFGLAGCARRWQGPCVSPHWSVERSVRVRLTSRLRALREHWAQQTAFLPGNS